MDVCYKDIQHTTEPVPLIIKGHLAASMEQVEEENQRQPNNPSSPGKTGKWPLQWRKVAALEGETKRDYIRHRKNGSVQ